MWVIELEHGDMETALLDLKTLARGVTLGMLGHCRLGRKGIGTYAHGCPLLGKRVPDAYVEGDFCDLPIMWRPNSDVRLCNPKLLHPHLWLLGYWQTETLCLGVHGLDCSV
jgi:hypothetical protein